MAQGEFTVSDLITRFRAARECGWSAQTRKHFAGDLKVIEAGLGTLPVTKVTRRHLARFLINFHDGQVAAGHMGTRGERLAMLIGALFRFAVEREFTELSPAQRLPKPAVAGKRSHTLSEGEIAAVWGALAWVPGSTDGIGPAPLLVLKLSLATGQRIGAIAAARVEGDRSRGPNAQR